MDFFKVCWPKGIVAYSLQQQQQQLLLSSQAKGKEFLVVAINLTAKKTTLRYRYKQKRDILLFCWIICKIKKEEIKKT